MILKIMKMIVKKVAQPITLHNIRICDPSFPKLPIKKSKSPRINKRIEKFVNHKYDLVAIHAKTVLNYNGYSDSYNNSEPKKWWGFWK